MDHSGEIRIGAVLAGFAVIVASSIVLSILSPLIFSQLVRSGELDALVTHAGPLGYALAVLLVSSAFGVFICNQSARSTHWVNAVLVILLYAAFTYWLSLSPSNQAKPYPLWYVLMSYIVLAPGAIAGHYVSRRLISHARQAHAPEYSGDDID